MERIIYNTKLKKIFISFTIVVLLFGYIIPLKSYASVASDLVLVLSGIGLYYGGTTSDCDAIIRDIEKANELNTVSSSQDGDGNIRVTINATNLDDVKAAFAKLIGESSASDIVSNVYKSYGEFSIIVNKEEEKEENDIPEEDEENEEEGNTADTSEIVFSHNFEYEEGKNLYIAFWAHNLAVEQDQRGLAEKNADKVASEILKSNANNKIEVSNNNVKIYVSDTSIVESAFQKYIDGGLLHSLTQNIGKGESKNSWKGAFPLGFIEIIKTGDSFEDESLTEEENKIAEYLDKKYPGLGKTNILVLIEHYRSNDGVITVTFDESGNVKDIYIDPNFLANWGIR